MKYITILLALFISTALFSQEDSCKIEVVKAGKITYPDSARVHGIEGMVKVEIIIDKDGTVVFARVQDSDDTFLNEEAVTAATRYEFKPLPHKHKMILPIKFKLKK